VSNKIAKGTTKRSDIVRTSKEDPSVSSSKQRIYHPSSRPVIIVQVTDKRTVMDFGQDLGGVRKSEVLVQRGANNAIDIAMSINAIKSKLTGRKGDRAVSHDDDVGCWVSIFGSIRPAGPYCLSMDQSERPGCGFCDLVRKDRTLAARKETARSIDQQFAMSMRMLTYQQSKSSATTSSRARDKTSERAQK
jgi:hypothetical protein